MNNYKNKYIKYKKKYILLKNYIGGFNIGDFVETTNESIITHLLQIKASNIYIVRKIFEDLNKINVERIDSPNILCFDMEQVKIINTFSEEEKRKLMLDLEHNIMRQKADDLRKLELASIEKEERRRERIAQGKKDYDSSDESSSDESSSDEHTKIARFFNDYYLATQSRYKSPLQILRPFGKFEELDSLYPKYPGGVAHIKSMYVDIPDKQIVGNSSQYGIYFRLVKKSIIDKHEKYTLDEENFKVSRSFLFDFYIFLKYIEKQDFVIPLFWYSNYNAYGRTTMKCKEAKTILMTNTPENFVLEINDLEKKLNEHEFVCRIPIPLTSDTGFIGKINSGIL